MTTFQNKWPIGQEIKLFLVDDGQIPFYPALVEVQLMHQADFLMFISGGVIKARYCGRVPSDDWFGINSGEVYVRFMPEDSAVSGDRWAHAQIKYAQEAEVRVAGGIMYFRPEKIDIPEKFPGLLAHELGHILGMSHNGQDSIMSNQPYLPYEYQGMYRLHDYQTLYSIFLTRMIEMPTWYAYGMQNPNRCKISIPRIDIGGGAFKAAYLDGEIQDGKWLLWTYQLGLRDVPAGQCEAYILNDQLHFPLRYQGSTLKVSADIRQTNTRTEFFNVGISQ